MALPRFIIVKSSDDKYLRYVKDVGPYHACLQFTELADDDENVEIQYLKFEVVNAKSGEGAGLVHIRNCYNNKYFVRKSSGSNLIVGEADEAEEDQSKWSCTLFKPVFVDSVAKDAFVSHDEPQKIRLLHIDRLGEQDVSVTRSKGVDDDEGFNLVAGLNQEDESSLMSGSDVFTVIDVTSFAVLPTYVSFKGHNGLFGAITTVSGNPYVEFKTSNSGTTGAVHKAINFSTTQSIAIQNKSNSQYWSLVDPYIIANSAGSYRYYRAIRLGGNEIALRCLGNSKLVNCGQGHGLTHMLGASTGEVKENSIFQVVEPVLRREIRNVRYNIADARIYNVGEVKMYEDIRDNETDVEQTGTFSKEYKTSKTTSWTDSVSVTTAISASFTASIPYIGDFGIGFSHEETQQREWGEEKTEETTVRYSQDLDIPPWKRIIVRIVWSKGSCDVPFTCDVLDTMTDGYVEEYTKTDGLFVGSNHYLFNTEIDIVDIPSK